MTLTPKKEGKKLAPNKMIWLRTTNPLLLEIANGYFEAIWNCTSYSDIEKKK